MTAARGVHLAHRPHAVEDLVGEGPVLSTGVIPPVAGEDDCSVLPQGVLDAVGLAVLHGQFRRLIRRRGQSALLGPRRAAGSETGQGTGQAPRRTSVFVSLRLLLFMFYHNAYEAKAQAKPPFGPAFRYYLIPSTRGRSSPFPLETAAPRVRLWRTRGAAVLEERGRIIFQDAIRYSPAKGLYLGYDTGYAAVPLGGKRLGQSDLGHGLRSPFRTVCRNFILPDLQAMSLFSPFSIYATYRGC